jgi:hypothetical protein
LASALPVPIFHARVTEKFKDLKVHSVYLEIPLDRTRLAALERERNGSDLRLRLEFELVADELVEVAQAQVVL